jgi:cytochrome c-type biogenesis protein CcmE
MARNTLDDQHIEFTNILEELLASDQAITAHEIVRRHSTLSSASIITRHPKRRELPKASRRITSLEKPTWKNIKR